MTEVSSRLDLRPGRAVPRRPGRAPRRRLSLTPSTMRPCRNRRRRETLASPGHLHNRREASAHRVGVVRGRRTRRPTTIQAAIENQQPDAAPIDVELVPDVPACIDLTEEEDGLNTDTPIIISSSTPGDATSRSQEISDDDDAHSEFLDDLPVFNIGDSSLEGGASTSTTAAGNHSTIASPTQATTLQCPICFDSDTHIVRSGRRLMSTICGHLFCSKCIKGAIAAQKKCPSCRKKLSMKQVHPIFL